MPLEIMLPMVVFGIAGIALLLHVLGLSRPLRFEDELSARAAWLDEFPTDRPLRVILSHDHSAALIETSSGKGIVFPMGADSTARYLDGAKLMQTETGVRIDLPDYGAPHVHLRLDDSEIENWPNLIEGKNDRYAHLS